MSNKQGRPKMPKAAKPLPIKLPPMNKVLEDAGKRFERNTKLIARKLSAPPPKGR